jgi:NADPH:quinone reductase-like Zn-dependent oxidoreductase
LTRALGEEAHLLYAGAAHVVATSEADLLEKVTRINAGKGAHVAFDPVGGENFDKLISELSFQASSISTVRSPKLRPRGPFSK